MAKERLEKAHLRASQKQDFDDRTEDREILTLPQIKSRKKTIAGIASHDIDYNSALDP